ncbi:hypothetical protein BJV82DRAFT_670000 [Fennellomyces sp. T-0311]|nr:hypothetical protein BJV82DRAFT_670000 [Fennellomyces sp. T-0311]
MDANKKTKDNTSPDPDALVDEFDEKVGLHSESSAMAEGDELDEKAALQQDHQNELDALLEDTPPSSRPESRGNDGQETAKRNDAELQHIFNQFDNDTNKDNEDQKQKNADGNTGEDKRTSTVSESSASATGATRRPSLAEIKRTAEETKGRERQEIPFDFNRFLEQMRRRGAMPITRYFKSFLQAFDRRPWAVNEQIKIIQDFLDFIYVKMRECEVWRSVSDQEFENAKEGMEKLVMNRLYHATFSPSTTDDKERDEILYQKISIFRWIREQHLDIPDTTHNESFLTFAETELLKINNYKAPRDKLICILNCCKVIFGLIKHVGGEGGADKFLPILIYVVLRANPPRLVSNVQYISRFRNPEHLQSESGYYLTNLMGSITFIESMDASSLSITKEEFDANIERTMAELEQERPSISQDKQKINYDNAVHPSRSPRAQPQPLIDPVKAAALLEKGSNFAQKTMQKPLNFVGKIFQGLNEGSPGSSDDEHAQRYYQQQQQYGEMDPYYYQQLQQQQQQQQQQLQQPGGQYAQPYPQQQSNPDNIPHLPPRPLPPDPRAIEARRVFEENLQSIITMFPNIEPGVCYMILQANENHVGQTVDTLLEMSDPPASTAKTAEEEFPDTEATLQLSAEEERTRSTAAAGVSSESSPNGEANRQ